MMDRRSDEVFKDFFQLRRFIPKCLDSIRFTQWEFLLRTLQCCHPSVSHKTIDFLES